MNTFSKQHLTEAAKIIDQLDDNVIEKMVGIIAEVRENQGRLFFLGVGGSAGNASHAVNDFRKIAKMEAYTPVDNVSELTAFAASGAGAAFGSSAKEIDAANKAMINAASTFFIFYSFFVNFNL